ncbi:MAG: DHHA1 domain-containing protein [Candidatus Nanoarchaeia archaeon]|nr:DHHA1 domain-containing protein [Candidatus Nanoarchaeia archaeon]
MEDELEGVKESKRISMMHTAEHIFFKALEKQVKTLKLEKIRLDENESSLFVMAEKLDWEIIFRAEELANQIIKENRKVRIHETTKADIGKFPGLRVKLERIEGENVRVIEVENHDFSACSGKHCETTGEINNILITKFRKSPAGYEIRFKVDAEKELLELARTARLALEALGTEQEKVIATINNLKSDVEILKKAVKSQRIEAKEEKIGCLSFVFAVFEGMDKKLLTDKANDLMKEKTVLCFINKADTLQVMIMCSTDSNKDASAIIKKLNEKLGGKGGGKQNFAMCSVNEGNADKVISAVKELVK